MIGTPLPQSLLKLLCPTHPLRRSYRFLLPSPSKEAERERRTESRKREPEERRIRLCLTTPHDAINIEVHGARAVFATVDDDIVDEAGAVCLGFIAGAGVSAELGCVCL